MYTFPHPDLRLPFSVHRGGSSEQGLHFFFFFFCTSAVHVSLQPFRLAVKVSSETASVTWVKGSREISVPPPVAPSRSPSVRPQAPWAWDSPPPTPPLHLLSPDWESITIASCEPEVGLPGQSMSLTTRTHTHTWLCEIHLSFLLMLRPEQLCLWGNLLSQTVWITHDWGNWLIFAIKSP